MTDEKQLPEDDQVESEEINPESLEVDKKFNKRYEDAGFVGWLQRPASNISVATLFLGVCLVFALISASYIRITDRVTSDEQQTCLIQSRGLPVGHQLAASLDDIHSLLTVKPTSAAQKLAAKNEPPALKAIIFDLNYHLAQYQAKEGKQPRYRNCN